MAQEQVTSADQRKPDKIKLWYAGWLLGALLTLSMLFGNHRGRVEDLWLVVIAAGIVAGVIADYWMRKRGMKR